MDAKLERLRETLRAMKRVIVAYSGGVDSALVMSVAYSELGSGALACIGVSPSYPRREMRDAVELARRTGVPFRLVDTTEHLDENYASNPTNRCFFCKTNLYDRLVEIQDAEGFVAIVDGNNQSDLGEHRSGITAAREHRVRSPLIECGIGKAQVRAMSHALGLPVWDKPAMACLSSRVPHGTAITPALLRRIEQAEDVLADLGFRQFRVRHHDDTLARIELPAEDLRRAIELRERITDGVRRAGYRNVTLDLSGFRSEPDLELSLVQLHVGRASMSAT